VLERFAWNSESMMISRAVIQFRHFAELSLSAVKRRKPGYSGLGKPLKVKTLMALANLHPANYLWENRPQNCPLNADDWAMLHTAICITYNIRHSIPNQGFNKGPTCIVTVTFRLVVRPYHTPRRNFHRWSSSSVISQPRIAHRCSRGLPVS